MSGKLTKRQKQILEFLKSFEKKNSFQPSVREIAAHFGFSSPMGAYNHLKALHKKGFLVLTGKLSRARKILQEHHETGSIFSIPLVGTVSAGKPLLAVENIEGYIQLDKNLFKGDETFGLRVKGDSMKDAGIYESDIVIVRQQNTAEHGEIVVALLNDDVTVKRLLKQKGRILLHPENPAYEDIVIMENSGIDFNLIGRVVAVIRRYF
jgi:repressor LexA